MKATVRGIVALAFVVLAASIHAQSGGDVVEEETETSFPQTRDYGGSEHTLIGVGAFEAFGAVNVYGAGFYVDSESAARSWQRFLEREGAAFVTRDGVNWAGLKDSTALYQWISSASFGRGIWFKFVHDATRQHIIDLHNDIMRRLIDNFDEAASQSPLKDFVDATCQDVHAGEEMFMWTRGSNVFVKLADRPLVKIEQASSIVRAIWGMWFGPRPIQVPLRRGLVDRIEILGGPVASR